MTKFQRIVKELSENTYYEALYNNLQENNEMLSPKSKLRSGSGNYKVSINVENDEVFISLDGTVIANFPLEVIWHLILSNAAISKKPIMRDRKVGSLMAFVTRVVNANIEEE